MNYKQTTEEKYSNLRTEILGMIETGSITVGALGLSEGSFKFLNDNPRLLDQAVQEAQEEEKNRVLLAELERGKTYALPIEDITHEVAGEIAQMTDCTIVLLPRSSFNLALSSKQ